MSDFFFDRQVPQDGDDLVVPVHQPGPRGRAKRKGRAIRPYAGQIAGTDVAQRRTFSLGAAATDQVPDVEALQCARTLAERDFRRWIDFLDRTVPVEQQDWLGDFPKDRAVTFGGFQQCGYVVHGADQAEFGPGFPPAADPQPLGGRLGQLHQRRQISLV